MDVDETRKAPAGTIGPSDTSNIRVKRPRTVSTIVSIWTVFVVLHALLSGRWSLWVIPAMIPPIALLAIPAILVVITAAFRRPVSMLVSLLAVVMGFGYSGVNLPALTSDGSGGSADLRVVSFNTRFFGQDQNGPDNDPGKRETLVSYLRSLDADVYLLQEHMIRDTLGNAQPITDDSALLQDEFPGYQVAAAGELLTLSKFPIVHQETVKTLDVPRLSNPPAPYSFRTDLQVGNKVLSTFNVHMPVQIVLEDSPLHETFYKEISQRAERRSREFDALTDSVVGVTGPTLVAGDFNTSPAMGDNRALLNVTRDAARSSASLYPRSWVSGSWIPKLWRLDWAMVRGSVDVASYDTADSHGISDHDAQLVGVSMQNNNVS